MNATTGSNGTVFCTNCGHKLAPEDRFCPECGTPRPVPPPQPSVSPVPPPPGFPPPPPPPGFPPPPPFQSALAYPSAAGGWSGGMPYAAVPDVAADNKPELRFDVEYPERSSRLLALIRLALLVVPWFVPWGDSDAGGFASWGGSLLVLPHLIVLTFLGIGLFFTTFVSWFAILILGRYPRSLWEYARWVTRWGANVQVFSSGLRDQYPPFSGSAPYPAPFEFAYPPRLSRLLIFVKWLLIIPHWFVLIFVSIAAYVAMLIGWIAVILTGRFPKGLHEFVTGWLRWSLRASVYIFLLTDRYPPFSTSQ